MSEHPSTSPHTDLTVEEIEDARLHLCIHKTPYVTVADITALCDMALRAARSEAQGWIRLTTGFPAPGMSVLGAWGAHVASVQYSGHDWHDQNDDESTCREPDYWTFLPSPPEAQGVEIRNKGGSLDEVCAPNFHLEQMSATHWWMAVDDARGSVHVNLHSKATIRANVMDERLPAPPEAEAT